MRALYVAVLAAIVLGLLLAACGPKQAPLGSEKNPIVMSFVPSGEVERIATSAEELGKLLEKETGYKFKTNVATSYAAVVEAMGTGKAHIGWLNTLSYLLAHKKYGVEVILVTVRYGQPFYKGQIIVRKDSGIKDIKDLKGKTACWVDALSTSGYLMPRLLLKANGIDPEKDLGNQVEVGSHDNVVLSVYRGDCDFGATYVDARRTVAKNTPEVMDEVEVIATTPEIPNDNVSVIKDMPKEVRDKVKDALLKIAESEEGKKALDELYEIAGLVPKDDSFYDPFRQMLEAAGVDVESLAK